MKIWIKLLIGITLGILAVTTVPIGETGFALLSRAAEIMLRIGRYVIFPLVFFSLAIGTYTLKVEKKLLQVYGTTILAIVGSSTLLALVGLASVLVFSPRIPIIPVAVEAPAVPGFLETIRAIFPTNLFAVFAGSGSLMIPLVVLAILLGSNLTFDRVITRPIVQLLESLSRVFYHVASLAIELFWIAAIPIAATVVQKLLSVSNLEIYKELFLILSIDSLFVIFAIYPVLLYFTDRESNPFKLLYASLASALTGLVTGDEYLSIGMLVKHGHEDLGMPRSVGSAVYPLFAIFGKAGTAMTTTISFYLILNSLLPSADIDMLKILFVLGFSILISLALGSVPGLGAYIGITLMSRQFDAFWPTFGLLSHYTILEPVKMAIVALAVMLDVLTAYLAAYLVGRGGDWVNVRDAKDFI